MANWLGSSTACVCFAVTLIFFARNHLQPGENCLTLTMSAASAGGDEEVCSGCATHLILGWVQYQVMYQLRMCYEQGRKVSHKISL